jgi:hypothetical protein
LRKNLTSWLSLSPLLRRLLSRQCILPSLTPKRPISTVVGDLQNICFPPESFHLFLCYEVVRGRWEIPGTPLEVLSQSVPLPPAAARKRCHEGFSLRTVVEPIEEGLAKFGMTPTEFALRYRLYVADADISKRSDLIEIGNHPHSHYILSKLNDGELDEDLRCSHEILKNVLGESPEAFAYPFGVPQTHFDERCSRSLRPITLSLHLLRDRQPLENICTERERPCLSRQHWNTGRCWDSGKGHTSHPKKLACTVIRFGSKISDPVIPAHML